MARSNGGKVRKRVWLQSGRFRAPAPAPTPGYHDMEWFIADLDDVGGA